LVKESVKIRLAVELLKALNVAKHPNGDLIDSAPHIDLNEYRLKFLGVIV
jgi:hypothetical protein